MQTVAQTPAYFYAYHLGLGWHGIAHTRADGTVAFYPRWCAAGPNIVCRDEELKDLTFGNPCDQQGRRTTRGA
jgi:hypothetical protein